MHIGETLKEHPYMVAGGVFVAGVLLIIIMFCGNKTAAVATTATTDTQGATELAMAQLQAQAITHASDNAVTTAANNNATQVSVAQLAAATQQNHDLTQYETVRDAATINDNTAVAISTLQANVQQAQIGAALQADANDDDTAKYIAAQQYGSATAIAGIQGQTAVTLGAQQEAVALDQDQVALNKINSDFLQNTQQNWFKAIVAQNLTVLGGGGTTLAQTALNDYFKGAA